jgi:hypothetical protein
MTDAGRRIVVQVDPVATLRDAITRADWGAIRRPSAG